MKVCIARNAEARTNAALARVSNALYTEVERVCVLSRNRYSDEKKGVQKKEYRVEGSVIDNYEIVLKSTPGKGMINIFQLMAFQTRVFLWFLRNKEKYDMIHAFDLDVGLPAYVLSKISKKKYVYHIADFYADSRSTLPSRLKFLVRGLEFKVINNAVFTVVCTEDRIKQIEGSKPKKITVIHNTPIISDEVLDGLMHKDKPRLKNQEIVFTYVGGLGKSRFIEAALEVIKDYPQITLNIAGMGTLTAYVTEMSQRFDNIHYFGRMDYTEALKLYGKTDFMFALYDPKVPNHKYSAPNKAYEAMMLGKPIVVARNTGIDKIVAENDMGFVIDYTEEAFRSFLDGIVTGEADWEELGNNARTAYEKYSWARMKERLIGMYRDID